jgi:hypothetical protein
MNLMPVYYCSNMPHPLKGGIRLCVLTTIRLVGDSRNRDYSRLPCSASRPETPSIAANAAP